MQVPIVQQDVKTAPLQTTNLPQVQNPYVESTGPTNLFKGVQQLYETAQKQADQAAMVEAQKKMDDWETNYIFGPKDGALAKQGKDAAGVTQGTVAQFDKDFAAYRNTLGDDHQKQMFDEMAVSRRGTIEKQLANHETQQVQTFFDGQTESAALSSANRAALYYNVPDVRESSINAAKAAILSRSRVKGMSDEQIMGNMQKLESGARLAVLSRYVDNDPRSATDFFNKYAASFTADDLVQAQKMMLPADRQVKGHDIAVKVFDPNKSEIDMSKEIDAATPDLNVAAEAKKVVSDQLNLINESKVRGEKNASEDAWRYVVNNQPVPPSVEARMNPKDVVDMRNSNPDQDTYNQLRGLVTTGQPVDLGKYRWQLGEKGYGDLLELQQNPDKNVTGKMVDDMLKTATPYIIGTGKEKDKGNAQKLDDFRRYATQQVNTEQQIKGRPLTQDEKQKIIDNSLINVRVKGHVWDSNEYMYQTQKGDDVYLPGVPKDRNYVIGGKNASYGDVVDTLVGEAQRRKVQPTTDNLNKILDELSQPGGQIKWVKSAVPDTVKPPAPVAAPVTPAPGGATVPAATPPTTPSPTPQKQGDAIPPSNTRMGAAQTLAPLIRELTAKGVKKAAITKAIDTYYSGLGTKSGKPNSDGKSVIDSENVQLASYDDLAKELRKLSTR